MAQLRLRCPTPRHSLFWGPMIGSVERARKLELLGQIPLFAICNKRQLGQVAALTVPAELKKGTVMTRRARPAGSPSSSSREGRK